MQVKTEQLIGTVERVTFHSEESGFCVLKVKVQGQRDLVTVVGKAITVNPGENIDCRGKFVHNREFGLQFQADSLAILLPHTPLGMEKYLGSGLIKGIGPGFAKRLMKAFGEKIFEVIEKTPDRLTEVPGIGKPRQEKIIQSWNDQKSIREIMVFLQSYGLGINRSLRIYKTYGDKAIEKIRENPYCLARDIHGVGFKTSDALAIAVGFPRDSILRVRAGVLHCLNNFCTQGNVACFENQLIEEVLTLLELERPFAEKALQDELQAGNLIKSKIAGEDVIYLPSYYYAESGIGERLNTLLNCDMPFKNDLDSNKAIAWVEKKIKIELSHSQKEAIRLALSEKLVIITGGPGVGKTTLVNSIIKILRMKTNKIMLCAPTGRAAKRLSESTHYEAKTLHRLLEFDPKQFACKRNEENPLDVDVLVVDEMSMVDLFMMHKLLKALPDSTRILFVGDADQLPSVGSGMVLANLLESSVIPTIQLTEIFRQAAQSSIITNAHRINKGFLPIMHSQKELSDFYFIEEKDPERTEEKIIQLMTERIPKRFQLDPIRDVQILVPMNKGRLGVQSLNILLQKHLNAHPSNEITRFGIKFCEGDKVIQNVNNYKKEVFNGDLGFIHTIDKEEATLLIEFEGRKILYDFDELDEINLAYASTIHKAQGSEFPAVIIPITMQHYTLLERSLIYTAFTRGKKLVILIGEKQALYLALQAVSSRKRLTNLTAKLMELQSAFA